MSLLINKDEILCLRMHDLYGLPAWITGIYSYAWFVGFFVSGIGYTLMMRSIKSIEYVTAD